MNEKINRCLNDIRYSYKHKRSLEKVQNSLINNIPNYNISDHTYENLCLFVYKTDINNEDILKNLKKYSNYEAFINNQSKFKRFCIERVPLPQERKEKRKKYTTYSAHGHFQTNNPISVALNYIAMLPAGILLMIIVGIAELFESIANIFESDNKK